MKSYLGDGVYADLDPYGRVILTTENGISTTNEIILEPEVIGVLQQYLTKMHDEILERLMP